MIQTWTRFFVVLILLLFSPLTNILIYFFSLFIDSKFHNNLNICKENKYNLLISFNLL